MKLEKVLLKDIKTSHLDDGCFHVLSLIDKSSYLQNTYINISENKELYGVSLSVYKSMLARGIESAFAIVVSDVYHEKYDLYLQNITTNLTLQYHKVRKHHPEAQNVKNCEFDDNQLDLLYYIDLDENESMELNFIEEETAKIKKKFDITIVLKTLEQNYLIQKFFDTNTNEITYQEFDNKINKRKTYFENFLTEEKSDDFYKSKTYPEFVIKSSSIDEMNSVLSFFKINKDKIKTTRFNFKKIESFIS